MSVRRCLVSKFLLASVCLVGSPASAGEPRVDAPDQDPLISNGTAAFNCQWPTAVALDDPGLCTGTLVHPQIVVTSARCAFPTHITFGESISSPRRTVNVDHCMANPAYSDTDNNGVNGGDFGYCKLAQPVDMPITPPVFGCETAILRAGQAAVIAGFGADETNTGSGIKRWSETIIQTNVIDTSTVVVVGAQGTGGCNVGDLGAAAYVQYPDGSWHAFGILSGGPLCGGPSTYALVHHAVPFIEENSGIDITPCHDVDGTWNPTPACQGFALETLDFSVPWADWCATPRSGASATCGPAFNSEPDDTAPTVAILSPVSGTTYDGPTATLDIEIDAFDDGYGVKEVRLLVNGDLIATNEQAPYGFANAAFNTGGWILVAEAEDWAGNIGASEPVAIGVGQDAPELPGADDETGETDGGEDGGLGADVDAQDGCACSTGSGGRAGGVGVFAALVLVGLRRRGVS